jgi:hypothetical protein
MRAFPSWFLRIECDRCGEVTTLNEAHTKDRRGNHGAAGLHLPHAPRRLRRAAWQVELMTGTFPGVSEPLLGMCTRRDAGVVSASG